MTESPEFFTPPPDTNATGDVMQSHARVWRHVQCAVERCARSLTDDRDEQEDLIQEARVELWRIDPSRCNLRSVDDLRYLRKVVTRHMRKVASRGERTIER